MSSNLLKPVKPGRRGAARNSTRRAGTFRPNLELLEDRTVPTATWTGGGGDWSDPAHWTGGTGSNGLPGVNDDVVINVAGNVTVTHNQNVTDTIHSLSNNDTVQLTTGTLNIATTLSSTGTFQIALGTLQ